MTWHFTVFSSSPSHLVPNFIHPNLKCDYGKKKMNWALSAYLWCKTQYVVLSFLLLLSPPKPPVSREWMASGWYLTVHYLSVYYYLQYQKLLGDGLSRYQISLHELGLSLIKNAFACPLVTSGFWFLKTGFLLGTEGDYYICVCVRYIYLTALWPWTQNLDSVSQVVKCSN